MPLLLPNLALPPRAGYTPRYGADVSIYLPTSAKVRARFGDSWIGYGPAFSPVRLATKTAFRFDFDILSNSRSGDDAFLVFAGGELIRAFGRTDGVFLPYAGVGADLLFARVNAGADDYTRVTAAASAFVGTRLTKNGYLEARYRVTPTLGGGLNFSGTSLTLGVRF